MNQYQIVINGYEVKELRCKNDNCRALICYENSLGVIIYSCPRCGQLSVFNSAYRTVAKGFIEELKKRFENEKTREGVNK